MECADDYDESGVVSISALIILYFLYIIIKIFLDDGKIQTADEI
jgi:hypothetical protein